MTNRTEATSFTSFNTGLFERMQDMNRSWLEKLREIRQIEFRFWKQTAERKEPVRGDNPLQRVDGETSGDRCY